MDLQRQYSYEYFRSYHYLGKTMMRKLILLVSVAVVVACQPNAPKTDSLLEEVRMEYAPDKRVALYKPEIVNRGGKLILKGETDMPEAKEKTLSLLAEKGIAIVDSLKVLPDAGLAGKTQGVIQVSVANIRSNPKHSAELATQALLGMPVKVLKKEGDFYLVQTPDDYLGWVDRGGICLMDESRYAEFMQAPKMIYMKTNGFALERDGKLFAKSDKRVGDLVMGDILELTGQDPLYYFVSFPDGREARVIKTEAAPFDKWLGTVAAQPEDMVETAKTLMGIPYLWGGTSSKGMDCSGFTKTVYLMHGYIIPRDASQQVHAGELIDEAGEFDKLIPGDLLFFGRAATPEKKERISHVGMWIGEGEFIHASGRIKIGSMNPDSPNYDEFNKGRYIRTKRLANQEEGVKLLAQGALFQ